ncbi:hypothetical protein [Streptosporangium sp. NPDC049376]|uniref:hypothetical protein n=1 Tax=Streptosporangium sp. NPDC049376 TaxID=3366192 RepID=UPI0037A1D694
MSKGTEDHLKQAHSGSHKLKWLAGAVAVIGMAGLAACGGTTQDAGTQPVQSSSATTGVDPKQSPVELVDYPSSSTWGKLPSLDRRILLQVADIHRVFSRPGGAAGIWDEGFRPDRTPMVLGPRQGTETPSYAYVIGHPDPGKLGDATRVDLPAELGLPDVYRITKGSGLGAFVSQPFWSTELGGVKTWVMAYGKGEYEDLTAAAKRSYATAEYWVTASIMVHELFHYYQAKFRFQGPQIPAASQFPADRPAWSAMALLEHQVLRQGATTAEQARQILRTFLAVRRARDAMATPDVRANEQHQLLLEGTARYVEVLYVRAAGRTPPGDRIQLDTPLDLYREVAPPMPGRAYPDGKRLSELLDLLHSGHSWRAKLYTDDVGLEKLVREKVTPPAPAEGDRLISRAKQDHDYESLLRLVREADLPERKRETMEALKSMNLKIGA